MQPVWLYIHTGRQFVDSGETGDSVETLYSCETGDSGEYIDLGDSG